MICRLYSTGTFTLRDFAPGPPREPRGWDPPENGSPRQPQVGCKGRVEATPRSPGDDGGGPRYVVLHRTMRMRIVLIPGPLRPRNTCCARATRRDPLRARHRLLRRGDSCARTTPVAAALLDGRTVSRPSHKCRVPATVAFARGWHGPCMSCCSAKRPGPRTLARRLHAATGLWYMARILLLRAGARSFPCPRVRARPCESVT